MVLSTIGGGSEVTGVGISGDGATFCKSPRPALRSWRCSCHRGSS